MSKSATRCVDEVKTFTEFFRKILRHFQQSGKSTCILNEALDALGMKDIHLMTWCPTRMSNLLTCASQTVNGLLFALCDVMVTCDVKAEERDYLMSPRGMIILHLLADLNAEFVPKFLRKLDGDKSLIMEAYGTSQKLLTGLYDFKTSLTDDFIIGLHVSDVGNVVYEKNTAVHGKHYIILNTSAGRRRNIDVLEDIKTDPAQLREQIVDNLRESIQEQIQEDTIIEFSSCFDLSLTSSLDDRLENLEKLYTIYGSEYIHEVEDDSEFGQEWNVSIRYPPKLVYKGRINNRIPKLMACI